MVSAINSNADLQRFLFLYISGNYSRILSGVNRTSGNFDVRRAFTAHQLFSMLREAGHTVVLVEHDPSLFDGAEKMLAPVAGALKDAGRESLVILYTPVAERTFSVLMRQADRVIEIAPVGDLSSREPARRIRMQRNGGPLGPGAQKGRPAVWRRARGTGKEAFERGIHCMRRPSRGRGLLRARRDTQAPGRDQTGPERGCGSLTPRTGTAASTSGQKTGP
jgi:DNA polymerase I